MTGLPAAAPGYSVCFDASDARGGSSSTGYLGQCYRGVPWDPSDGDGVPSGATPVPVTAGRLTPAVDAALIAAGGITGTVTAAAGGAGLSNVRVGVLRHQSLRRLAGYHGAGRDLPGDRAGPPGRRLCHLLRRQRREGRQFRRRVLQPVLPGSALGHRP